MKIVVYPRYLYPQTAVAGNRIAVTGSTFRLRLRLTLSVKFIFVFILAFLDLYFGKMAAARRQVIFQRATARYYIVFFVFGCCACMRAS